MSHWTCQLNMTHPFPTHLGLSDFNAALFTDDPPMFETFIFATQTFVVFSGSENLGAKQTVAFGFLSVVINRIEFFDFTVRPRTYDRRRREADTNPFKIFYMTLTILQIK